MPLRSPKFCAHVKTKCEFLRSLMYAWLFFFLILAVTWIPCVKGEIEDHLKPIEVTSRNHQMRNIDCVYLINLDQRPEKWALCRQQLQAYGITPYRFSAVNGWELPLEVIHDVGLTYNPLMSWHGKATYYPEEEKGKRVDGEMDTPGRVYFYPQVAPGAIGCVLSHLSILQHSYDQGYKTIWIMEDDIEILRDPHILSDLIDELDNLVGERMWDVLFTDRDTKGQDGNYVECFDYSRRPNFIPQNPARFAMKEILNGQFRRIGARYGSYSMILRRSGIEKILNFIKNYQVFLPYDMEYTLPNNIRLYTVMEDVVSTLPQAPTDNGRPDYLNRQK